MKPVRSAADQLAFRLAIDHAEARLGGPETPKDRPRAPEGGKVPQRPQEGRQSAREARQGLPAGVESLERSRAAQKAAEADLLETLARKAGLPPDAAAQLAQGLRAQIPSEWTFVMLSPSQNSAVVRWLTKHSKRPLVALQLWARLFEVLRADTGEILQSRDELAQWLGILPRDLSSIMTELASINAIRREKRGREVRYFMNSHVATHVPGQAARQAAREADGPLLVALDGGQKVPRPK